METYGFHLRYEGLRADNCDIDASASESVIEGAKWLLASHASYYMTGTVPDRLLTQGMGFEVRHTGMHRGSTEYDFLVSVGANAFWDAVRLAFDVFILHAFLCWRERRLYETPEFARREPILDTLGPSNRPALDFSEERFSHAQRLSRRTTRAMHQITRPIGHDATSVELVFNRKSMGTWTRRVPGVTEDEITEAIRGLRINPDRANRGGAGQFR
jgi:hypothetical protein